MAVPSPWGWALEPPFVGGRPGREMSGHPAPHRPSARSKHLINQSRMTLLTPASKLMSASYRVIQGAPDGTGNGFLAKTRSLSLYDVP
jgi:hypothetical protein